MNTEKKIVKSETLKRTIRRLRKEKKKIAFTNGCFDILHFGHVSYLEEAKKNNRILILGLNSDSSIKRIKGPKRPINNQKARARVLAALECVDYVTFFSENTPYKLIQAVKPDILIKGADWKGKQVVGSDIVEDNGGRVEFIHFKKGFSTTILIKGIKKSV